MKLMMNYKIVLSSLIFSIAISATPVIKFISPPEDEPIIAYDSLSILGELKKSNEIYVNGHPVEVKNGLFKVKLTFKDPGSKEITFKAINKDGNTTKKLPIIILETYPDIEKSKYKLEIELLKSLDIMNSYLGTDFFKDKILLKKAEISRTLLKINGVDPISKANYNYNYIDLISTHWAYHYIQLALQHNLIEPLSPVELAPNQILTRKDILMLLLQNYTFKLNNNNKQKYYKDLQADIMDHRQISSIAAKGYLPKEWTDSNYFHLDKPVTRGELAFLVTRLDKILKEINTNFKITLPKYYKTPLPISNEILLLSFKKINSGIFLLEFNPDLKKKTLFIEFNIHTNKKTFTYLLVDDGEGVDLQENDNIYTTLLNFKKFNNGKYRYSYKLFDKYNLLYKVGEGNIFLTTEAIKIK